MTIVLHDHPALAKAHSTLRYRLPSPAA